MSDSVGPVASKRSTTIDYSEQVGWSGRKFGAFHYEKRSVVVIDFSYDARQEIGDYVAEIPRPMLKRAHDILHASHYQEQADHGTEPPETKNISFMEEGATQWTSFVTYKVPPSVQPAVEAMRGLIEWMRQHPSHVVRGSARWKKAQIGPRDAVEVTVRLESVGSEAIKIGHPALVPSEGSAQGALALVLSTPEKGDTDFELGPSQRVVTKAAQESEILELAPKAAWEGSFKKALYLSPGRYTARLVYKSHLEYTFGEPNVGGELPMALDELVVTP